MKKVVVLVCDQHKIPNPPQSYSMAMREKSKRGFPIGSVADLLEGMFLGEQALSGSVADLLEGMFLG